MSGLVALVKTLLTSMTLLLFWYECLHDIVEVEASLLTQLVLAFALALALASSLILRTIFWFVRTKLIVCMSVVISTVVRQRLSLPRPTSLPSLS
jgi:hypothetical protein